MSLVLLVTVDTEEEFDWSGVGAAHAWSMNHAAHLGWFQELCEAFGVKPTYVIDYPFATTDESVHALKNAHERGACEIGAHPHPWVNPPIREELSPRNTYLSNLPLDLQQEKVAALTAAITQAFGHRPETFKAGRYGFDHRLLPFLADLGYRTDTSVMPFCEFTEDGGPDYRFADWRPRWLPVEDGEGRGHSSTFVKRSPPHPSPLPRGGGEGTGQKGETGRLLEVPCTSGFNRWPFERYNRVFQRTAEQPLRSFRLRGILDRTGLLRHSVLSPELASESDCVTLMRLIAANPPGVLNITLHSPSVLPGCTPFVRTDADLKRFQTQLTTMLRVAMQELGAQSMTFREYHDHFSKLDPPQ